MVGAQHFHRRDEPVRFEAIARLKKGIHLRHQGEIERVVLAGIRLHAQGTFQSLRTGGIGVRQAHVHAGERPAVRHDIASITLFLVVDVRIEGKETKDKYEDNRSGDGDDFLHVRSIRMSL